MPYPMTRRKHNSTSYQSRVKKMFWQIEWVFPEVNLTLVDKRICEDDSLECVLDKHVGTDGDPLVKHKLKPYITAGKENWTLFMKQENTGPQERFYKLDLTKSLLENFRHKQIVEYPVIHAALTSHCSQYNTVPEVVNVCDKDESSTAEQTTIAASNKVTSECKQEDIVEHVLTNPVENVT